MIQLTTVATMRKSDAKTIASGISGRELMLRAAQGIFCAHDWNGKTAIVCGVGNNGGDGYALATLLQSSGHDCTLYLMGERFSDDGFYYYEQCQNMGIPSFPYSKGTDFSIYDTVVDCILGTGFGGPLEGLVRDAVIQINQTAQTVISADINSGLNGDNGLCDLAVRSNLTVSIGTYKTGLFLGNAKDWIGERKNVDIGIHMPPCKLFLAEETDFREILHRRKQSSHKGNYGYVTVMGGCIEYAGASKLANMSASALRAGCGVVQLAVPASIASAVAPFLLESTLLPIPSDEAGHMRFDTDILDSLLSRQAAIAVGMGWGRSEEQTQILQYLLQNGSIPLLIDADGLNTLATLDQSILKKTSCPVVLTPHLKEFERISGIPMEEILKDPITHASNFAREYGVCLLLKGSCTVVTDGDVTILVDRGCAGMATAGSGDVLAGILVGLLGYSPVTPLTVACGAYIAGMAGELAEAAVNPISMIASDTVSKIGDAISKMM